MVKAEEQRFCDNGVKEIVRRVLLPWHNAVKFLTTYTDIDQWQPGISPEGEPNILDNWIESRLQTLTTDINQHMQSYQLQSIVFSVLDFLDDLTNTYIRLNRARFWGDGVSNDKQQAYHCLYSVLTQFTTIMAPFAPFLSEHIYQSFRQRFSSDHKLESIHMLRYPQPQAKNKHPVLEQAVSVMQQIILLGRQCRNDAKIKIKTPLQKLTIIHSQTNILDEIKPLENYLTQELNVKSICYEQDEKKYIKLSAKINAAKLGRKLGKETPILNQKIQSLGFDEIQSFEQSGKIIIDTHTFGLDDILVYREALADSQALSNRHVTIALDLSLTDELIHEGIARELVNTIQTLRKSDGFEVSDRIIIEYHTTQPDLENIIKQHRQYIMHETLCQKMTLQKSSISGDHAHTFTIADFHGHIKLIKQP